VATRFTLPVRALALSPSGLNLAAGGDDEGIKLVDLATCKVFRQIKSQAGGWGGARRSVWATLRRPSSVPCRCPVQSVPSIATG
jgi:WD40 repeat protein